MNIALLTAGGVGNRMGQDIPKQFMTIDNIPVIIYTMQAFQNHPQIDAICVVCLKGWEVVLQAYANQFNITKLKWYTMVCARWWQSESLPRISRSAESMVMPLRV